MKSTDIRKFATLVKRYTQKEAMYAVLEAGFEPSVQDARAAGIADPYRVANKLRNEHDLPIYLNERKDRKGNVVKRYRLGTPRRNG